MGWWWRGEKITHKRSHIKEVETQFKLSAKNCASVFLYNFMNISCDSFVLSLVYFPFAVAPSSSSYTQKETHNNLYVILQTKLNSGLLLERHNFYCHIFVMAIINQANGYFYVLQLRRPSFLRCFFAFYFLNQIRRQTKVSMTVLEWIFYFI